MPAKFMHVLAEENSELKKSIGCMTGIFQMFDQQLLLTRRRRVDHTHKRHHFVHGAGSPQLLHEHIHSTSLDENERISMELSRTSFSSTSCSSFSTLECNRLTQQETYHLGGTTNPDNASMNYQFLDFRNMVKDSIRRDSEYLESSGPAFGANSSSFYSGIMEASPFSYDGSEISHQPSGSKENSMCSSNFEAKPNSILKDFDRCNNNQQPVTHKRSTSVIAKLMGLEAMPHETIIKNLNSQLKPLSKSSISIETAPWKQKEKHHIPQKTKFTREEANAWRKPENSLYTEIEKRLIELEFGKNNRDLRALKQILDAMEAKGLLEPKEIDQNSYETPIVIMKPAKPCRRPKVSSSSYSVIQKSQSQSSFDKKMASKNQPFNSRLKEISDMKYSNETVPSDSLSPKLQNKKVELEKLHPLRSSSNRNHLESVSPRGKLELKSAKVQDGAEKLSKKSETKNLTRPKKKISQGSEKAAVLAKKTKLQKPSINLNEVSSIVMTTTAEQPSPVSVLNASIYQDDLQISTLKESSNSPNDEKNQINDSAFKINNEKFQSIENLLKKLNDLASNDDNLSTTDHIASLCGSQNPDPNHRYISQILLASGILLKDIDSQPTGATQIQLHSSGYAINPDLFLVLEQTNIDNAHQDKHNRKLVFDVVNEILTKKLEFSSGQLLIKEVCQKVDTLQSMTLNCKNTIDEVQKSKGWINIDEQVPRLVLEIERLIFKDLIGEIVNGDIAPNSKFMSSRCQR